MAPPKRNANRRKFNRQPLDVDDLTSASSFSGIREVVESHFSSSDNADQSAEAGGAEGPRNVEPDPEHPQYVWEPKGVPFSVRLDAGLIARLEKESLDIFRAITNRGSEIGGILLGQLLPGWPVSIVVSDYEPVACAYTLGPSYLLSEEEQEKLAETIETRQKAGGLSVVGFFRSNTRPALVLQDDDQDLFEEFFPEDHNIFLLAKPYSRKPCQGAIYVREGGKIRTDVSALEFAFSRPELEKLGALQPGLRLSSQPTPARVGPASTADRVAAIPIDSALAEPKRPEPAPAAVQPEPTPAPPPPVEAKPVAREIRIERPEPKIEHRGEMKIEPRSEPKIEPPAQAPAQPPAQQRIEARLPWLKPTPSPSSAAPGSPAPPARPLFTPRPVSRPAAPPAESAAPVTPAPPARPLFTPPPPAEKQTTPPAAESATPAAPPARPLFTPPPPVEKNAAPVTPAPPARTLFTPPVPVEKSAAPVTPAPPARPLFTPPPPVEKNAAPVTPASPARPLFTPPPPAEKHTTPPATESAAPATPAPPPRPLFTPPAPVEKSAAPVTPAPPVRPPFVAPASGPGSPPRFSARIQPRIPPSVQPRIATNLGSKHAPGAGPAQPTRFMPRIGQQPAPQQPKPEPKAEATVAPKVEPAAPAKPPARTEPVVVVRPPAQPRTEVKIEPKAEVKVEPRVEPEEPKFTRIPPGSQAKPEPAAQPVAPPARERESDLRRKPEQTAAPNFGYKKPEPEEEAASDGKRRWILPVVIALVIAIVGVYFVIIRPNRKAAEEAPAAAAQATEHRLPVELQLRVEGSDAGLNIFWDGLSAPISTAPRGVLSIRDGASTKNFDLTSEDLKKGTYVYKPRTDDVLIRLDLKGLPGNQIANGGTRVFGARRLGKTSGK
jgi:hypothetical protein